MLVPLSLLLGAAVAAVPVEVPPGEPLADWSDAIRLAGGAMGPAEEPPSVRLVDEGATWRVVVRARDGTVHELVVAAPTDPADREDLLATALSLAEPFQATLPALPAPALPAPALPALVVPALASEAVSPPSAVEAPPPAAEPIAPVEAPVEAAASPAEAHPTPVLAAAPAPVAAPAPPPRHPPAPPDPPDERSTYLRVAVGPAAHALREPLLARELTAGVPVGPGRVFATVRLPSEIRLEALGQERGFRGTELAIGGELGDVGPWGMLDAGLASRNWYQGDLFVTTTIVPVARLGLGWGVRLGDRTRFRPHLWGSFDVGRTELLEGGQRLGDLDRPFVGFNLAVEAISRGP